MAHRQAEIVAGDVQKIALLDILTTTQMSAPHAAPVQHMGKGALDDLGPQLEALFCDTRGQSRAIVGDCPARRIIATPA